MYLQTPCPHCKQQALELPEGNGIRLYTYCASCGRKSLYIVHYKADETKSYSVVPVGAPNRGMVRMTFWVKDEQAEKLRGLSFLPGQMSEIVRNALDRELEILSSYVAG